MADSATILPAFFIVKLRMHKAAGHSTMQLLSVSVYTMRIRNMSEYVCVGVCGTIVGRQSADSIWPGLVAVVAFLYALF